MATYEFWYNETYTYKAWFTADDKDQALKMIESVEQGNLDIEDLPEFGKKDKNYEIELDTIEEI
jgi:hypothetical protein